MQEASKTFWSCQSHPKQMIQNLSVECCHTISAQMNLYLAVSQLAKPHLFSKLEDAGRSRLGFEYFQNQNKLINYPRTHSHTYYTLHISSPQLVRKSERFGVFFISRRNFSPFMFLRIVLLCSLIFDINGNFLPRYFLSWSRSFWSWSWSRSFVIVIVSVVDSWL